MRENIVLWLKELAMASDYLHLNPGPALSNFGEGGNSIHIRNGLKDLMGYYAKDL